MEPSLGLYSTAMAEPATTPQPDSDEALMLAFAAGDMAAFDTLYERHRRGLYAFIARLLIGRESAEERRPTLADYPNTASSLATSARRCSGSLATSDTLRTMNLNRLPLRPPASSFPRSMIVPRK